MAAERAPRSIAQRTIKAATAISTQANGNATNRTCQGAKFILNRPNHRKTNTVLQKAIFVDRAGDV